MQLRARRTRSKVAAYPIKLLLGAVLCTACAAHAETDLTALSLEQLMNLTVVGASKYEQKQNEVAAAVSIITRDEIRTFGWRTLDEALASLPGIYATYDRQYAYLGTRGFGLPGDFNTRLLVTINGNRTNDGIYDGGPMGRQLPLDLGLVERIEFIPGPGGAVYGQNAMFGVVNIITRDGASLGGAEISASGQDPQAMREGRASWGGRFDSGLDLAVSVSGMHARGENHFFDFGASGISGVARRLDGEEEKLFFARASGGPWALDIARSDHRKYDPTGAYLSDPLVRGQYQGDRYTLVHGQYQDSFRGDTLHVLSRLFAGEERYTSKLIYGTPFRFPATSQWRGGELRLLSTAWQAHKLMLGVEYQDNIRLDQSINNLAHPEMNIRIAHSGHRLGVYAQDEWRIVDTVTLTLGLRADRNNVTGTKISPRAALIWQAAANTTIKALYGRAFRAPNAFERDYTDGVAQVANTALQGEAIDTVELVADQRVGQDLLVRASLYEWRMVDVVTLGVDAVSGLTQYQSGGKLEARGIELAIDKTWDWGGRLRSSLSLQHIDTAVGVRQVNSPERLGKLNFSAPLPSARMRLGYELRYDSQRRSLNGTDLAGYALSNLQLTANDWLKGLALDLGIYNLFDKRYRQPGADSNWQNAIEQDGRSLRLDASYRF